VTDALDGRGIVVVDDDDLFLNEAKRLFDGRVPTDRSMADVERRVEDSEIDLVILGPSFAHEEAMSQAGDLVANDPELGVVLVAETVTAPLLKSALRNGLTDVVEAPLTVQKVEEAIGQIDRLQRRRAAPAAPSVPSEPYAAEPQLGTVVTVMSAKGGSGKTVFATNVAMVLGKWGKPEDIVMVDGDLQFGDVCLVLQLEPKFTVVNAAHDLRQLDEAMLDSLLTKHSSGMRVLAAPLEPAFADEISTAAITEIVEKLRSMFKYVIIDTASMLDELLLSLLERADKVLFIVDMDLPSVKNAKLALETLRLLKFPASKIQIVLNRSNAKARLDEKEIERSLKMKIMATVPSDGIVPASVNEGRPVVESTPKSKVAKGFESVAKLVAGTKPAPVETSSDKSGKRRWM
jgi:pilus assembly protein CpaE